MKPFARVAFCWALGLLSFALVCLAIGKYFPQEVNGISLKFSRFAAQKKHIDTIFVGSSRIYHGIDPAVFDRAMKAHGHPTRSFNVAMDGMNTEEAFGLVRHLLALHPRKLKTIFFEVQPAITAGTPLEVDQVKVRDVYWRDWPSVVDGTRIFAQGLAWPRGVLPGEPFSARRLEDFGPRFLATARLWFRNFTHVGSGLEIFGKALAQLPPRVKSQPKLKNLPPNWNGYYAMTRPMDDKTLATYRKSFADQQAPAPPRVADPMMRSELQRFVREMAPKGIRVVFVAPPSLMAAHGSGVQAPLSDPLFDYDDLGRYPQFYAEENRLDTEHLNARGAEIFSRTMAEDYSASLPSTTR